MKYLGIDLGTTSIKGAVLDLEQGQVGAIRQIPFPEPISTSQAHFVEFDPQAIIDATSSILTELLAEAPSAAALVMCGQMHGLTLMTERGKPLSNFVSWKDQRALTAHPKGQGSYLDHMAARLGDDLRARTGNELRPGLATAYLFWLVENDFVPTASARLGSVCDFVLAQLSGGPPRIDLTNAAAFGALDLPRGHWSEEAIESLGLEIFQWPEIKPLDEPAYDFVFQGKHLRAYPPLGDHQCALSGIQLVPDELSINISTGSQVACLTKQAVFGDYQTRPFPGGLFLNTITHIPAGRALNLLIDLLTELPRSQGLSVGDPWAYITQQAEALADTNLRAQLAFYESSVGSVGSLTNLTQETLSVGHLFRAAFTNMADHYRSCAKRIDSEETWSRLTLSGGLARKSSLLRGLIQERFNQPMRLVSTTEETLQGLLEIARATLS